MRLVAILLTLACAVAAAQPIERSRAEIRAFRADNPCPATGQVKGACPGYAVDHIRPLCAGGEDKRQNLQWISNEDHAFKTRIDTRECKKFKRLAATPARER
jgi:hypothetical protein